MTMLKFLGLQGKKEEKELSLAKQKEKRSTIRAKMSTIVALKRLKTHKYEPIDVVIRRCINALFRERKAGKYE